MLTTVHKMSTLRIEDSNLALSDRHLRECGQKELHVVLSRIESVHRAGRRDQHPPGQLARGGGQHVKVLCRLPAKAQQPGELRCGGGGAPVGGQPGADRRGVRPAQGGACSGSGRDAVAQPGKLGAVGVCDVATQSVFGCTVCCSSWVCSLWSRAPLILVMAALGSVQPLLVRTHCTGTKIFMT